MRIYIIFTFIFEFIQSYVLQTFRSSLAKKIEEIVKYLFRNAKKFHMIFILCDFGPCGDLKYCYAEILLLVLLLLSLCVAVVHRMNPITW